MDHVMGAWASGRLPVLDSVPGELANRPNGVYVPRFRNLGSKHPDFIRGYGFQGGSERSTYGHAYAMHEWGPSFKKKVRESRTWQFGMGSFGESLGRFENFCELDKDKVDAWGIPVLHISMSHGDNEKKMLEDARQSAEEIVRASGAEDVKSGAEMSVPGEAIHEVGTARMGNDPRTSVVNRWQRAHDVSNLFLMDGAVYPSSACQNPTITIMALAASACDHLVDEYRRGNV
jgi:choline dehydrogenase-like flavoprotein